MKLIYQNWMAKTGSLLVALVLTWYVQSNRNVTRDVQIRVIPPVLPGHLIFANRLPAYLKVQLNGPRELMDFPMADFKIRLTNTNPEPDENVPFKTKLVPELPSGINAFYAQGIRMNVDRVMIRALPVEPIFKLSLAEKAEPGYFRVDPPTIRIKGPRKTVQELERIETRMIDIRGYTGVFKEQGFIAELPPFVILARKQSPVVEFSMIILNPTEDNPPDFRKVVIKGLKPKCSNRLEGFEMSTEKVDIIVKIPVNKKDPTIKQFEAATFCRVRIDRETKKPVLIGNIPVRVSDLRNRSDLHILQVIPNKISLNFVKKAASELVKKGAQEFTRPKPKPR